MARKKARRLTEDEALARIARGLSDYRKSMNVSYRTLSDRTLIATSTLHRIEKRLGGLPKGPTIHRLRRVIPDVVDRTLARLL